MDKIDTRTQRQILSKKSKGEGNKRSKNSLGKSKPDILPKPLPTKSKPKRMKKGGKA